jgi:hypothetical protein
MSKYEELATVLTEERYLVEALEQLGYKPEVHKGGAALYGYLGDERPEKAQVIVRRQQRIRPQMTLASPATHRDNFVPWSATMIAASGFDEGWVGRVAQAYKECQTMAVAKSRGYVFQGRSVIDTPQGKKVQLRFAVR